MPGVDIGVEMAGIRNANRRDLVVFKLAAGSAQAAEAIEDKAGQMANVTYTHPNEDGSVTQQSDPAPLAQAVPRVGRNDPCPCGSGKKYKLCHGRLG